MTPQKINPRILASSHCHLPLLLALTVSMILPPGNSSALGQTVPVIDPATIQIEPGSVLTFQFQASGQAANAFLIEVASEFASIDSWNQATGAVITAVADGVFAVTLAMQSDHLFCRIRALDSGEPGPPLLINEVMSDNVVAFPDGNGNYWDWVEIYNPNDEAVNMDRYALTDEEAIPAKWRFPPLHPAARPSVGLRIRPESSQSGGAAPHQFQTQGIW